MHRYIFIVILGSLFDLNVQANVDVIDKALNDCRLIENDQQRLNCYDEIGQISEEVDQLSQYETQDNDQHESFPVLLADLEEPRIFASVGNLDFFDKNLNAILLGIGTRKKITTFEIFDDENTFDFNAFAMIRSQFDVDEIDTRNNRGGALINSDFSVGGELVKSLKNGSVRLRYTHRSTHLGDEFLIDNPEFLEQRLNLSYETLDILAYRQFGFLGAYTGIGAIIRSEPSSLDKLQWQGGLQYLGHKKGRFKPVLGLDLKSWQETDWHVNTSFKAGLEMAGLEDKTMQLLLEYYDGKSPYGQFFREDLKFLGLSFNHYW